MTCQINNNLYHASSKPIFSFCFQWPPYFVNLIWLSKHLGACFPFSLSSQFYLSFPTFYQLFSFFNKWKGSDLLNKTKQWNSRLCPCNDTKGPLIALNRRAKNKRYKPILRRHPTMLVSQFVDRRHDTRYYVVTLPECLVQIGLCRHFPWTKKQKLSLYASPYYWELLENLLFCLYKL